MNVTTISIDLAKSVFQLLAVDRHNKTVFKKRLGRTAFQTLMQQHLPVKVVMEACYSSHYWGRLLTQYGHAVSLIPAQHVKPFLRGNKNDGNDALAILEASQRPHIRPVPIKTEAQQEILMLHSLRERLIQQRTATSNQIRGLLVDFGVFIPKGHRAFETAMQAVFDDDEQRPLIRLLVEDVLDEYRTLNTRIERINRLCKQTIHHHSCGHIMLSIPGVGPIIASAFLASIDKGQAFKSAKDFAVWLGLTPKQYASGNKSVTSGITKRGNCYLRKQLVHGARALTSRAKGKDDAFSVWITQLREKKHYNCVTVAVAHRLARLIWTLLQKQETYQAQTVTAS